VPMPIDHRSAELEEVRARLREAPLCAIRQMLPDSDILCACRGHGYEWRRRKYGPVVTVLHFLAQAIQREESFAATRHELRTPLAAEFPGVAASGPEHSGLTHARGRFPEEVTATPAERACRDAPDGGARWKGLRLKAIDGTTESMPREDMLCEHSGRRNTKHGPTRFPLARFVSLLDVETCTIMGYRFGGSDDGGFEELCEFMPSRASISARRALRAAFSDSTSATRHLSAAFSARSSS
jgi:hypothetical protein